MHFRSIVPSLLTLPFLLAAPAAAGQVLVVDDDGGPGVDHTDLQAAIDAAASGDVILVKDGLYGAITVAGKGVTVVAEADAVARVDGPWTVLNLPAGELTVLRGLSTATPGGHGATVRNCAGAVWLEDCTIVAAHGSGILPTGHGVEIETAANVVVARCTVTAGNGANLGLFGEPSGGGHGVSSIGSQVAVLDCDLTGGHGADAPDGEWYDAGRGGSGVWVFDSVAIVAGGAATGGTGGEGDYDDDIWIGKTCGDGGEGGSGVEIESSLLPFGAPVASAVTVRDHLVTPGQGGWSFCGSPGADGQPVDADGAAPHDLSILGHGARSFSVNSPVRGGTNARLEFAGSPGDVVLALVGSQATWLDLGQQPAPYVLADFLLGVGPWTLGASGTTIQPVPIPPQGPSFSGATLPLMGVVLEVESGLLTVAPPSALTLLNQAF